MAGKHHQKAVRCLSVMGRGFLCRCTVSTRLHACSFNLSLGHSDLRFNQSITRASILGIHKRILWQPNKIEGGLGHITTDGLHGRKKRMYETRSCGPQPLRGRNLVFSHRFKKLFSFSMEKCFSSRNLGSLLVYGCCFQTRRGKKSQTDLSVWVFLRRKNSSFSLSVPCTRNSKAA